MKKGDYIVISLLLTIFIVLSVKINSSYIDTDDKYVSVQVNGEEIKQITISEELKTYPIRTSFGLNVLQIKNKKVKIIEASCPDKIDVKFGEIDKVGQSIICMPNRLIIQIKSNKPNELDVVN